MIEFVAVVLGVLAASVGLAAIFIRRSRAALGILVGLLPLAALQLISRWSISASVAACVNRACASAGLPPGCNMAAFGCTEWSGLSLALFSIAGIAQLVLYAVCVVILLARAPGKGASPTAPPPPSRSGSPI
ncbi:MAG TPA: hypothetical protein VK449_01795 [Anaerolineales bacterium]|nr:hypothetical protein [Anaerolineales bacterium]